MTSLQAPWVVEQNRVAPGWPDEGRVEFKDYATRYRPELELVIQEISCSINGGEKVGSPKLNVTAML